MFKRCCSSRKELNYQIEHRPRPIKLSEEMDTVVKKLLWYAPNIDSYQSSKNELISDKLYDEFSFSYIINQMGMEESYDVKWLGTKDVISDDEWKFFERKICTNCQKIIVSKYTTFSKTNALLTAIRNSIAHGHFSIVDEYFIGFNRKRILNKSEDLKKAIIKIKPKLLLKALEKLTSPIGKEELLSFAFERVGYKPTKLKNIRVNFDLCLEKNDKKYVIEIKSYKGKRYLHPEHIERFLRKTEERAPGFEKISLIDTSRVTKSVRVLESKIEGFRIVDINQVKQLLEKEPVDILVD